MGSIKIFCVPLNKKNMATPRRNSTRKPSIPRPLSQFITTKSVNCPIGTCVTHEIFPAFYVAGYTHYDWVNPQKDPNEAGFFQFLTPDNKKTMNVVVNSSMLANPIQVFAPDLSRITGWGKTTFTIQNIPIDTFFGWDAADKAWVYVLDNGQNFKIQLHLDIFNRQTDPNPSAEKTELLKYRLIEQSSFEALNAAMKLKVLLGENHLNIVTVESLTGGMIAKTLVDIPGYGATVYGGFVVYDTDAKRKFLDVRTTGVYSHRTAHEMAVGALQNSRATVAIAVTGNAMVLPNDIEHMGQVYFGIGLRIGIDPSTWKIITFKKDFCKDSSVGVQICRDWGSLHTRVGADGNPNPAPLSFTSIMGDYMRQKTVRWACDLTASVIAEQPKAVLRAIRIAKATWDEYCKPSWILGERIFEKDDPQPEECNAYDVEAYDMAATTAT